MKAHRRLLLGWVAIVMLILLSCNFSRNMANTPEPGALYTQAAQTVEAAYTQSAALTPRTETPAPVASATSQSTDQAEERCNQIEFISDATIPDGTLMTPENEFIKTWRLKNSGTCAWTSGYALIFDHGDQMDGDTTVQFTSGEVKPGEAVDISVRLTAPEAEGSYQGHWKLRSDSNEIFGLGEDGETAFWVEIRVTAMGAGGAESGTLHLSGSMEFGSVVATGDLDEGIFAPEAEDGDISLNPTSKQLETRNGALFTLWGTNAPTFSDCLNSAGSHNPIPVNDQLVGKYICYHTNLGKPGMIQVTLYNQNTFAFNFVTWKKP